MDKLNIVRGDLRSKPVASKKLADYFEQNKNKYEGTLYIGYPIIGTAKGGYQIDALLITKEKGLIAFNIEEGVNSDIDYQELQDESYNKLNSKLTSYKELTKKRQLVLTINIVTYAPAWAANNMEIEEEYPLLISDEDITGYIDSTNWEENEYYEQLLSVLQSITTIRRDKSRSYVRKEDSRGAKLKKLEDSIANLDRQQNAAVIETVEGVQRIRGLAGSGKTIILALKVAYLHAKHPDWEIAVTFNTRSLKGQFKKYVRQFCYEHITEEPNWENIDIIHAWGNPTSEGIYFNLCKEHDIEFFDFKDARTFTHVYGKEFDEVSKRALSAISTFRQKYDLIVVDEAQDFSKEFLRICYNILRKPKRLVYAYDELQSLNVRTMASPEEIFGKDANGQVLVNLTNEIGKPKEDIILYKCYRNSLEILTSAHALGFGIYRENLVQMFDNINLWNDIGYQVTEGNLEEGENVKLERNSETSPEFLSNHSPTDDLLIFKTFRNQAEQVLYIVNEIEKHIKEDELKANDIMVINPNPLTTKSAVGEFRKKLFDKGINSSLAGVSSSPDIFYQNDIITFTGIYRAKGNEASMVYIINADYCYKGLELAKKRNMLFTAMTRSKAWVRVCGVGNDMQRLEEEFNKVKANNFSLSFTYPTEEKRKHMNIVNRDMSSQEKSLIKKNRNNLGNLIDDLQKGQIKKEDLSIEQIEQLKKLIS